MKNNNSNKPLIKEKTLSPITSFMSDSDRANYLKNKYIKIVRNIYNIELSNEIKNCFKIKLIQNDLLSTAEKLKIVKEYKNIGDTNLKAYFSKSNLKESIHKSTEMVGLYYVFYNIEEVLKSSVKIEEHLDIKNDSNIKTIHEFLSIINFENTSILLVKITIKELNSISENNVLYTISSMEKIKKIENASHSVSENVSQVLSADAPLSSTINIAQLVKIVNSPDILRYIPNELLSYAQINIKTKALERYNIKRIKYKEHK